MKILFLILIQMTMIIVSGCQLLPDNAQLKSYRVLVQQGNVIDESKVDSLKINMTKEQVIFLMGEPVVNNIFDKERWDYVYYKKRDPEETQLNIVSIFFKDENIYSMKKITKNDDGLFDVKANSKNDLPEFINDEEAIALKKEIFDKIKLEGTKDKDINLENNIKTESVENNVKESTLDKDTNNKKIDGNKNKISKERKNIIKDELSIVTNKKRKNDSEVVREIILEWAKSWQNKNLDKYFSYYSANFTLGYFEDNELWKKDRIKRISSKNKIKILIKDLSTEFIIGDEEKAFAIFKQEYISENYSDEVIKKITLIKNNDMWLIESEELIDGKY
ncbi:outer membrane protein assembly factor BamE [Gammaproteobacteria bacterium]|nr:outer membrane protein assembly factor BamE [Gammaproteobacteria bacterium]